MSDAAYGTFTCPQCMTEHQIKLWTSINIAVHPELRKSIETLSYFQFECPNCGKVSFVLRPCLYLDSANAFLLCFSPDGSIPADVSNVRSLSGYTLRCVKTPNAFLEKVNILERGLDDRAMELTKLVLYLQLERDGLDVVDLVFHSLEQGNFRFVAVLPNGEEQHITLPPSSYGKFAADVRELLYTPGNQFSVVDMDWAKETLALLYER